MTVRTFVLLWFAASTASAQLNPRATVVIGAGRAGNWETSIAVTNTDTEVMFVRLTPELRGCALCPDPSYATTTAIAPGATLVFPSLPGLAPPFNGPQAVYVTTSLTSPYPVVSAVVADKAGACERSLTLSGLPLDLAFARGDLVFPGLGKGGDKYSNLIMAVDPPTGPPDLSETTINVAVRDKLGTEVARRAYLVRSPSAVTIVDLFRELGVQSLEDGSVWLSAVPSSQGGTGRSFAAVMTVVEPHRALAVHGTRLAVEMR